MSLGFLEALHLTLTLLGAGDTEVTGHGSCLREVLSLLVGPGKQADSSNLEFQDGGARGCRSKEQHQTSPGQRSLPGGGDSSAGMNWLHEGIKSVYFKFYKTPAILSD